MCISRWVEVGVSNAPIAMPIQSRAGGSKNKEDPHLDVWRNYWRRVGKSDRTGIWHETYLVRAGEYEAVYGNMPPHGLGKAGLLVPVAGDSSARNRIRAGTRA